MAVARLFGRGRAEGIPEAVHGADVAPFAAGVADSDNPLKAFIETRRAYLLQATTP